MNSLTSDQKNDLLNKMKSSYKEQIEYMGANSDSSLFSWENGHLKFIFIKVPKNTGCLLIFNPFIGYAEKSFKDELFFYDFSNQNQSYDYDQLEDLNDIIAFFNNKKLLVSNDIISNSILPINNQYTDTFDQTCSLLTSFAKDFAKQELENSNEQLKEPLIDSSLYIYDKQYYIGRFNFEKILLSLDDKQFASELIDCIIAYEKGLWFVCAAGLGSVIEHLLYLSIGRLDMHYQSSHTKEDYRRFSPLKMLTNNPTKTDYLAVLKKYHNSFDMRTKSYLDSLFTLRNSIDHYNNGYANKTTCETLLQGITPIYSNIYINS